MRRAEWLLPLLLIALVLPGCNRLSFIKPDPSHRGYTQVAPDYDIRPDRNAASRNAAALQLRESELALQSGRLDDAERHARTALRADAGSQSAHTLLAVIADQRGQAARAGEHYARALALAPNQGIALNNRAVWLCGNNRAAEALPLFHQALADPAYPTPVMALANAGRCALSAGQPDQAERDLRHALQLQPDNATALEAMAELSLAQGRALDARGFIQRRLDAAAPTEQTLNLAARIESTLGDNAASRRYLQEMKQRFPQSQGAADRGGQD